MPESFQRRETKVRSQRVHIMCEVEIGDAVEKVDLPFVVGVLADLSGNRDVPLKVDPENKDAKKPRPLPEFDDREFTNVTKANFDEFLQAQAPRLRLTVPDRVSGSQKQLSLELHFRGMDDFSPEKIAQQIEPLKELLQVRESLKNVRDRAKSKTKLAGLLEEIIGNTDKRAALGKELGLDVPPSPPAQS